MVISDGYPRTVNFINDVAGQALRRDEDLNDPNNDVAPHEAWYRFAGREMAVSGNNGTAQTAWEPSAKSRATTSGTGGVFRYGQTAHSSYTEADPSLDRINSYNQGSVAGSYTVRGGETLSSIAAQLWGDAGLWYKIAEANGMTAATALMEGQSLIVPAGVNRNRYDASTFRPYDASDAIGDASPTNPKMPKKNKCGMMGQIMMVAVAIAVTALSEGTLRGCWPGAIPGEAAAAIATRDTASPPEFSRTSAGKGSTVGAVGDNHRSLEGRHAPMKAATVYQRRNSLFIHSLSQTTAGIWVLSVPVLKISDNTPATVGKAVSECLSSSAQGVAQPISFANLPDPLLELAGVRSFDAFAKSARCVELEMEDDAINLIPTRNEGRENGFVPLQCDMVAGSHSPEEIGSAVLSALEIAE